MSLHHNRGLHRVPIVLWTAGKYLKSKSLVEALRCGIRRPDLQKTVPRMALEKAFHERPGYPPAAIARVYGDVQNLRLTLGEIPPHQESGEIAFDVSNQRVEFQIVRGKPLRCLRAGNLDGTDRLQIGGSRRADRQDNSSGIAFSWRAMAWYSTRILVRAGIQR